MARQKFQFIQTLRAFLLALTTLLVLAGTLVSQTNTGNIRGVVYDTTNAVIQGVTVVAEVSSRGVKREVQTSETGEYLFSLLDPDFYTLQFSIQDFAPVTVEGVEVRTGFTEMFSMQLEVAAAEEMVVISSESTRLTIEPERTQQSDHIDSVAIQNLPINRRDYLDLALLTPGVVDTNYVVDASDFRIAATPQSGIGIGGTGGRGNSFMLDGISNVYSTGSVRSSISQEAVQEFQVNRNSFSSELGGAAGGAINIVTKSGTNDVHGTIFGLLRNRSFQSRNYFDPDKSAYTRTQSGMSLGGPIARNRTFLYGAYERLDRHESVFVPLLDDRSFLTQLPAAQQTLLGALSSVPNPAFAPLLQGLVSQLTPGNYPHVVKLYEDNSGVFPFSEQRQQLISRFDHTLRDGHNMFIRVNWTGQDAQNTSFGALTALSRGRYTDVKDYAFAFGDTYVISPSWVSETRAGYSYHNAGVYPTDQLGPAIDINGFGNFGRDFILPAVILERSMQVRQNFIHVSRNHTFKLGGDFNPANFDVDSRTFFSGRFIFGEGIPLSNLIDTAAGPGFSGALKATLASVGAPQLAPLVDSSISSLQAYALGLPLIYQQGFGDPIWKGWGNRYNFFMEDSWRVNQKFTLTLGLRYELEQKTRFPRDNNNFAPRAGFAWSPDSKTVIRGGFGIYFSRIDGQIGYISDLLGDAQQIYQVFVPLTGLPGVNSALTGRRLTSAEIYQTAIATGVLGNQQITPENLQIHGINPGPGLPLRVQFRVAKDIVNPYAKQGSFEIQREFSGYAFSIGYNYNSGIHLIRPLDTNIFNAGTNPDTGRPIVGFHNPLLLQDNVYVSSGNSYYNAMILQLKKRFSNTFFLSMHHTWSKTMDETTDYNSSFEPHLQWDAKNELALSSFHRAHRFVAQAIYKSPLESCPNKSIGHNLISDFTLSGILIARSGGPFNLNAGYDNVGDRHTDTHRPFGIGRNVGKGPSLQTLQVRLMREFPFGETRSIQVVAEAFNLLNHTNFKNVNGNVGAISAAELPASLTGQIAPVTEAFAFTSAFEPRQFQFSVRFNF